METYSNDVKFVASLPLTRGGSLSGAPSVLFRFTRDPLTWREAKGGASPWERRERGSGKRGGRWEHRTASHGATQSRGRTAPGTRQSLAAGKGEWKFTAALSARVCVWVCVRACRLRRSLLLTLFQRVTVAPRKESERLNSGICFPLHVSRRRSWHYMGDNWKPPWLAMLAESCLQHLAMVLRCAA